MHISTSISQFADVKVKSKTYIFLHGRIFIVNVEHKVHI